MNETFNERYKYVAKFVDLIIFCLIKKTELKKSWTFRELETKINALLLAIVIYSNHLDEHYAICS